jgi:MoaA/NifB/PqqE/SkfB family radical SAM enzyme
VEKAIEAGVDGMNVQVLWTRPPERAGLHNKKFPEYQVREGWADESLLQIDFKELEEVLNRMKRSSLLVNVFPAFTTQQIHTWYTTPAKLLKDHRAKCPWMMANVFHDGTMRMCDDVIIGDLNENSFWDVWNSERMTDFRRTLKNHKHFPICAGCCSMFRDNIL